jgi:hypothetical protein
VPSSHPTATRPRPAEQQVTRPAISAGMEGAPPPLPRPAAFSSKNLNLHHWYMLGREGADREGTGIELRAGRRKEGERGEEERPLVRHDWTDRVGLRLREVVLPHQVMIRFRMEHDIVAVGPIAQRSMSAAIRL